jgi:hypothetical protein
MNMDELSALGAQCLAEYEGRLMVRGIRPFDDPPKKIAVRLDGWSLTNRTPDEMKQPIVGILEQLVEVGPFVMSEPEYEKQMPGMELRNAKHKDLRLSFAYGWSIKSGMSHLWISCHCYPSPE